MKDRSRRRQDKRRQDRIRDVKKMADKKREEEKGVAAAQTEDKNWTVDNMK